MRRPCFCFYAPRRRDPRTARVEHLIAELERSGTKVAIPTPALSEVLIQMTTADAHKTVETFNRKAIFSIEAFDQRAAIELAMILKKELKGNKLKQGPETWAKLKYDRQIVAIAKVCGVSAIYSDDRDIRTVAKRVNIPVLGVADLPLPPDDGQPSLFEEETSE